MKNVYGYIRVSTVKQGTGVSLQEQKEAIIRYAESHQLNIVEWFEEKETAAKQGRPLFNKMMKMVKNRISDGIIIHKIDRSARNLKDWALLGDLIDAGHEVHFAHESLDMDTRGGRLAADIQAVIASDYIRNLREEACKGLYGRLKQGIFPFYAPIGYLNCGRGQIKKVDPIQAPLVRKTFELYSSGNYNLKGMVKLMQELGLRNTRGSKISIQTISKILNNPFYTGIMKVKGKTFQGNHEPLISPKQYFEVQDILRGKTNSKIVKHDFLFRRLIKCKICNYSLIGEKSKGYIYYRCHTKECPTKGIREELVEKSIIKYFEDVRLHPLEDSFLKELLEEAQLNYSETYTSIDESLKLQRSNLSLKLEKLTDAYIESVIDKSQFDERKQRLMIEMQGLKLQEGLQTNQKEAIFRKAKNFLELLNSLKNSYLIGIKDEKRKLIKIITSNLTIQGKKLMIAMKSPFYEIANRPNLSSCALDRDKPRTCTVDYAKNDNFPQAPVDNKELRQQMEEILEIIMKFCELQIEDNNEKPYDI
ncbi:MAG: recombinase family protein [Saprospiraceae bacterium]|nr:recombinase family protein [Saprospiraceae bacterium]